jgi:hypothetical protein
MLQTGVVLALDGRPINGFILEGDGKAGSDLQQRQNSRVLNDADRRNDFGFRKTGEALRGSPPFASGGQGIQARAGQRPPAERMVWI